MKYIEMGLGTPRGEGDKNKKQKAKDLLARPAHCSHYLSHLKLQVNLDRISTDHLPKTYTDRLLVEVL